MYIIIRLLGMPILPYILLKDDKTTSNNSQETTYSTSHQYTVLVYTGIYKNDFILTHRPDLVWMPLINVNSIEASSEEEVLSESVSYSDT